MAHNVSQKMETIDSELRTRIERLGSTIKQARACIKDKHHAEQERTEAVLKEMEGWLDQAIAPGTSNDDRVRLVLRTDAELCLYEPTIILDADVIRLEDRFYRLKEDAAKSWKERLAKCKSDEPEFRQLLRHLTYDLQENAARFDRTNEKRADALFSIMIVAFIVLLVLIFCFVGALWWTLEMLRSQVQLDQTQAAFIRSLPGPVVITLLIAGCLGAMINVVRSMLVDEKMRAEYKGTLLLNVGIRVAFGAVYAIVVVFALFSEILPLKPSTDKALPLLMFLVVAAVAAGWSDQLFGKVISAIIEGKSQSKATEGKAAKKTAIKGAE